MDDPGGIRTHLLDYVHSNYGSLSSVDHKFLVFNGAKLEWSKVSYIPAHLRIVDDFILKSVLTEGVDTLKIEFSSDHYLTVGHNGRCMDIGEMVEGKPNIAVWEDWEEKFQSYSANPPDPSLVQIIRMLSDELEIEVKNRTSRVVYKQVLRSKAHQDMKHNVESFVGTHNWSRVRFKFFGTSTEGFENLIKTRLVEINATVANKVSIEYNDQILSVKNFSQLLDGYPSMIFEERPDAIKRFCIKVGDQIELGITRSNGASTKYCFINGRRTMDVATIINLVVRRILEHARKKDRNINEDELKSNMTLFMSCLDAPSDAEFNSRLSGLPDDFLDKCVDNITIAPKKCEEISALSDATEAGGKNSMNCTLILAEGRSAKLFIMSGIDVLGHEHYGVLALMGKLQNVRGCEDSKNIIIQNIMNALGLDFGACYKTANKLRYGQVMMMMDEDADGSHIKGLVINLFETFWPSLLRIDRFLSDFSTPLVKAKAKHGGGKEVFYTMESYNRSDVKQNSNSWRIVFIKGLGGLNAEDAREFCKNE